MTKPIAWTIAGSDSGGGAGIQTDLHTFQALGVHGCSVITALTAQNSISVSQIEFASSEIINAQIKSLADDLPAAAIKIGMLGEKSVLNAIVPFLAGYSGPIVYDPVLFATVGDDLFEGDIRDCLLSQILPLITLLTPNLAEAEWLLNKSITNNKDIEQAAQELLKLGPKSVLIKAGHATFQHQHCKDYFASATEQLWLSSERQPSTNTHGTGCSLASAITACLALDYSMLDALVIAKAYINQGIRSATQLGKGPGAIAHHQWPSQAQDFPLITPNHHQMNLQNFPACRPIEFYPIVDQINWVMQLLQYGVKTIQIRIKEKITVPQQEQLLACIAKANEHEACIFINDDWELAIKLGAYGVHLGQDDLTGANLHKIQNAGLRLGISAHCYSEIARALAYQPSYIALGPIYPTSSKIVPFSPLGIIKLQQFCQLLTCPVVAIGGANLERLPELWESGVSGVAVISAIMHAVDPESEIKKWLGFFKANDR